MMRERRRQHGALWVAALAVVIAGCGLRPAASADLPIAAAGTTTAPTTLPTPAAGAPAPTPTVDAYPGWASYTQETYGFTLHYPAAWGLTALPAGRETGGGTAPAEIRLMRDGLRLTIQLKASGEPHVMGPSGTGAGELVARDTVGFLGRELPQQVLVYEGKDKAITAGGEIEGLVFHIQLDEAPDPASDYAATALPAEAQAEMMAILASCELDRTQAFGQAAGHAEVSEASDTRAGATRIREADGMTMVYVPAGRFEMGSDEADIAAYVALCEAYGSYGGDCTSGPYEPEQPAHPVVLDAYWIDRTEVTVAQYEACVEAGVCEATPPVMDRHGPIDLESNYPATTVFWDHAATYCAYVDGRLPTEAEWEYAARGPEGLRFPWGDAFDPGRANYCDARCGEMWGDEAIYGRSPADMDTDDGYATMAPVGTYPGGASWSGALDMAGNVGEWTADWIGFYTVDEQTNPTGPQGEGERRVIKGGSWIDFPVALHSAARNAHFPEGGSATVGFRCVVPVK